LVRILRVVGLDTVLLAIPSGEGNHRPERSATA
jgi:hypothetical protein